MIKVSFIQTDIVWNDPQTNVKQFETFIRQAAASGSRLVVLPEMFTTGFSFLTGEQAKEAASKGIELLERLALELDVTLAGSLPELVDESPRPYNTLYVVDRTGIVGKYRKMHLFTFGGEPESYQAGDQPLTLSVAGLRVSFAICYDLRFAMYFHERASVTDLFVVVANWPKARQLHWDVLLQTRAIENQAYVLGVNRIGKGGSLEYTGGSSIIAPTGERLVEAEANDGVFSAEIDAELVEKQRSHFPVLSDRRPLEVYR